MARDDGIPQCALEAAASQKAVAPAADLLDGAVVEVLDPRLSSIHVEPKAGEDADSGFPRNLHNAAELLVQTGRAEAAQELMRCAAVFFALVEGRCGSEAVAGRACICWQCGHCGLERGPRDAGVCSSCGEASETNFLQVVLGDGVAIPWKEVAGPAAIIKVEDDKDAKRAAVAAAVAAARQAQDAAAAEAALRALGVRLRSMQVKPNGDEAAHPNFPGDLFRAFELLVRVGRTAAALELQRCTDEYLAILDEGPQAAGSMGPGFVCFECGHCGLAPEASRPGGGDGAKACVCTACGCEDHTNFVDLVLPNGPAMASDARLAPHEQQLPWMSRAGAAGQAGAAGPQGRSKPNAPCPCGSGKKAKKCCQK